MAETELEGILSTTDGAELNWRAWLPGREPRAVVFIVHGLFEHSGRYRAVGEYLRDLGLACWSIDLRGHGASSGRRVHVNHFDAYARDVGAALSLVRERHPDTPVVLLGHSMGGVVAIRYTLDFGDELHGLVLSAPGLAPHPDSRPPSWRATLGRWLSRLLPKILLDAGLDSRFVSRDPEVVAAYRADPLIGSKVSARWFTAYEAARKEASARADELRVPTLLLIAGADRLVDPRRATQWAEDAPRDTVTVRTWPECYHELLNEPERLEVLQAIEDWLDQHLSSQRAS